MIITLPAVLKPITRRADKSVKLSFDTRELSSSETLAIMQMEMLEGHLLFSTNQDIKEEDIPEGDADLNNKSQSQRLKAVLYKLFLQDVKAKIFLGDFPAYYKDKMEKLLTFYKDKIID
jgi:uncharacterized protein YfaA (DUF2138 family)